MSLFMTPGNLQTPHESEIDQIHNQQLAEKDAEIDRLELDLSNALGDSQDKDAEIEGLKARVEALRQIREEDKTLLTELVYWIESLWPSLSWGSDDSTMGRVRKLIQRGREATRDE